MSKQIPAAAIANEPFEEYCNGKPFMFKILGQGRTVAIIGQWLQEKYVADVRMKAQAFEVPKERSAFVNDQLNKMPRGDALNDAAIDALAGDDEYRKTKGAKGKGPFADIEVFKRLILRAAVKPVGLEDAFESMSVQEQARLSAIVIGIRSRIESMVADAGGVPEKKTP
jgi:hypothetical protein